MSKIKKRVKKLPGELATQTSVSMTPDLYKRYIKALEKQGMSYSKRVRGLIEDDLKHLNSK